MKRILILTAMTLGLFSMASLSYAQNGVVPGQNGPLSAQKKTYCAELYVQCGNKLPQSKCFKCCKDVPKGCSSTACKPFCTSTKQLESGPDAMNQISNRTNSIKPSSTISSAEKAHKLQKNIGQTTSRS